MGMRRFAAVGWSAALLAGFAALPAAAQDSPAPVAAAPSWAHTQSDVPVDPSVRWGVLPNGMRYAIRRNQTPPGSASLRLRIDVGSLYEADDQRGVAHFIEHLALNETRNLPEGELLRRLERAGLQFGADSNAITGFEETVYKLDLPRADTQSVDTGLFLLREVAGEATFRDAVVDHERGVILAEGRTRAGSGQDLAEDELRRAFPGDLLGDRLPIGSTDVIRTVTPQRIADFYRAYYRPERALLVAVGDFDVAAMETAIRTRFSDWRGQGEAGPALPPLVLPANEVRTGVTVQAGLPNRVLISWTLPRDTAPDTRASRSELIRRNLALSILNRRLERRATGGQVAFVGAAGSAERLAGRADVLRFFALIQPGEWRAALTALQEEHSRILQHGFTTAEIQREGRELAAQMAEPISSASRAEQIVGSVAAGEVYNTFRTLGELLVDATDAATPELVLASYRNMIGDRAPAIHLSGARPVGVEGPALAEAWAQARSVAVTAPEAQRAVAWPYGSFGTPGVVAERQSLASVGATAVSFGNGVRLIVKPTRFGANEVLVAVRFAGGLLTFPAEGPLPTWLLPLQGFTSGGTGRLDPEQLALALAGRDVTVGEGIDEGAFFLSGKTRTSDLATQLQLLAAYATDPGFRASNWDRYRALGGTFHDSLESTPGGILQRDLPSMLRGGDPRWLMPDRAQMASMSVSTLETLIRNATASAPIEVIIVGDVEVDHTIKSVAATFGALPRRGAALPANAGAFHFPAGQSAVRRHEGRADQALGFVGWRTEGALPDQRATLGLSLLARVFQLRLNEEVRERQGTAYAPQSDHLPSEYLNDFGYLYATVEAPPERIDGFFSDAEAIARSLRDVPIEADELERARLPLIEQMTRARAISNEWWLVKLGGLGGDAARFAFLAEAPRVVAGINAADLQRLARTYLVAGGKWQLSVLPEPGAATAGAPQ